MRRIAERVGISATGLYTHFYDKAALVRELLVVADDRLDALLADPIDASGDPIHALCLRHVAFVHDHRWLLGIGPPRDASAWLADDDPFVRRARELLCESRGCDDADALRLARHLRVALEGIAWVSTRVTHDDAWAAFADGYVHFLVGAIG